MKNALVYVGLSDHHSGLPHGIDTLWGNTSFDGYLFDFDFAETSLALISSAGCLVGLTARRWRPRLCLPTFPIRLFHTDRTWSAVSQKTRVSTGLYAGLF